MWCTGVELKFIFSLVIVFATFQSIMSGRVAIVGGQVSTINQFPHLGVYYSNKEFVCSASILSTTFAITAAHCTYFFPWSIQLRFGSSFRDRDGLVVNVMKFYQNPNFNIKTYDFDVSLLKFSAPIRFARNIVPIRLPQSIDDDLNVRTSVRIAGWGLQAYDDMNEPPIQLMSTVVQVSDFRNCSRNYRAVSQEITERMFCASSGNRDACLGDSGGSLVFNDTLYGLVSFGYGCAMADYPGVYTKISSLLPWIRRTLQLFS